MQRSSRTVSSSQSGVHPRLAETVRRHQGAAWRKPAQEVDAPALVTLQQRLQRHNGPLILDSFCGTAMSTKRLAEAFSEALVIGVDQSAPRLAKAGDMPDNCLVLQAHCEAVWRYLVEHEHRVHAHYLLYPNPWPKPGHLGRRVHGHPAFTLLPKLGGIIELRSNWQVYVEEFGVALNLLGIASCVRMLAETTIDMTLFERKYRLAGQPLWQLSANTDSAS